MEVTHKSKHIWTQFKKDIFERDNLVFQSECHKISKKSKKLKPISISIGLETLYYFKKNKPCGMLQLTVCVMTTQKSDNGVVVRICRNNKYVDILCQDSNILKQTLAYKCLQTTFHEEFGVTKMIGKGSFAKVYLATKKSTGISYAVKAFNKEYMLEQFKGKESLENEIRVMRRLNQENLVHLYETYETQNSIYFILDLLQGGELLAKAKNSVISCDQLQKLMFNLIKALFYIHSKKCIHRDLKPENLLLKSKDSFADVVIADFGLANFLNEEILFKRCGTPGFVAPEILMYKEEDAFYDEKCDIFSAGVIFYLLITGKQPFLGSDYKSILRANKNCEVNYNVKQIQQASPDLLDLLKKMLQPNPKERFSAEQCLKHPYFSHLYSQNELLDNQEGLKQAEVQKLQIKLTHKESFDSQTGSMELMTRSPVMNGNVDTMGSLSNCSGQGSQFLLDKLQAPQPASKFSQFCSNMKQAQEPNGNNSPQNNKKSKQQDLHKFALKNSIQQKMSKDDDFVNEESAQLDSAIKKLNSQTPKIGLFKKSASFEVTKSQEEQQ